MNISSRGVDLIKSFEGLRLTAYLDAVNVLTIGYGHTGHDVEFGQTITEDEAEALLRKDIGRFEAAVNRLASKTSQGQFDAMVSFAFNLGEKALERSTLLKMHNAGQYQAAADQFLRWNRAGGKILRGLTRRRAQERGLYLS